MSLGGGQQQGAPQMLSQQTGGIQNTSANQYQNSNTDMGPWNPQQPFLTAGFGNALNQLQTNSTPLNPNNTLQASWNDMTHAAQNSPASFQTAGNYYNDVLNGKYLSPNSNPYLAGMEQAAADPMIRQYQTAIAPGTASAAEMAGRYGSGAQATMRQGDEAALAKGLGDLSQNFYGNAYNQGINQMQGAAAAQPGYLQASYMPSQMENQVGQQQQAFYQAQQQYPWLTAQMYQQLVGGGYGSSGTSSSSGNQYTAGTSQGTMTGQQSTPYSSDPLGSALGGVIGLAGTAGKLGWQPFSDVRLKERIAHIGKTHDGQNLYSFRYKGDPMPHVGLMAQEVEQRDPGAVITHESGFKMVDYDRALHDSIFMPRMAA